MKHRLAKALEAHLAGAPLRVAEPDRLLWHWFADLSRTRTYHAAGPHPISYAEIEAYARLMQWPLEPRHVALIRELDAVWIDRARKQQPAPSDGRLYAPKGGASISPSTFDAMFK